MATEVLIVGNSGTGKSSSVETLNPKETFIINIGRKPLPFSGWKSKYVPLSKENPQGNYHATDVSGEIINTLRYISEKRPDIKQVIIDDYQYSMANEYMRRASETGFKKFTDIGFNAWNLISEVKKMREDLIVFFLTHAETDYDAAGNKIVKAKTIGKLLDNTITLEGMFTVVLFTNVEKKESELIYSFTTQNDGTNTCKSPKGMFSSYKIPNDLKLVTDCIREYEGISVQIS
jgi:hypothetical protein